MIERYGWQAAKVCSYLVLQAVRKRWHKVHGVDDTDTTLECAMLTVLRVAVSDKTSQKLTEYLEGSGAQLSEHSLLSQKSSKISGQKHHTLADELLVIGKVSDLSLQVEALSALTGICENYGELLRGNN